jgi:hypothetical protein
MDIPDVDMSNNNNKREMPQNETDNKREVKSVVNNPKTN